MLSTLSPNSPQTLAESSSEVIAFYCGTIGKRAFEDWLPVAKILRGQGHEAVFLVDRERFTEAECALCEDEGFRVVDVGQPKKPEPSERAKRLQKLIVRTRNRFRVLARMNSLLLDMERITPHLQREKPTAMLTFSDGFSVEFNAVVCAAAALGIPSLMAPLAFFQPPLGYLTTHTRRSNFQADYAIRSWWHRLLATLVPSLAPKAYGLDCFGVPLIDTFASFGLGIKPRIPHSRAGGDSVRALAPLEKDRQSWIDEGVNPAKIIVTGSAIFDRVTALTVRARRDRVAACQELGLDPARRLILVNFAALAELGFLPVEDHKNNLRTILRSIRDHSDAQIIVSVHPGLFPDYFHEIAAEFGATATQETDVAKLIALCDFYVSAPSTTLCLALGAGKPVVDLYFLDTCRTPGYDRYMRTYLDLAGTILCWDLAEMTAAVKKLLTEPGGLDQLTAEAGRSEISEQFDGHCSARIADNLLAVARQGLART